MTDRDILINGQKVSYIFSVNYILCSNLTPKVMFIIFLPGKIPFNEGFVSKYNSFKGKSKQT